MTVVTSTDTEWAWAAGLFEGEGCITHTVNSRKQRGLRLVMTDRDVVERFQAIVGCGKITGPHWPTLARKPQWRWNVNRWEQLEGTLRQFLPYLGERRRIAAEKLLGDPVLPYQFPDDVPETCGFDVPAASNVGTQRHYREGTRPCRRCRRARSAYDRQRRVAA